jgi:hypothetical protein
MILAIVVGIKISNLCVFVNQLGGGPHSCDGGVAVVTAVSRIVVVIVSR